MTYSDNDTERLELLQKHRQENNQFWDGERSKRQALILHHQQEVNEELMAQVNYENRANILRRHMSENMEFRVISDERQRRLRNQHQQELDDLTIRQNASRAAISEEKTSN